MALSPSLRPNRSTVSRREFLGSSAALLAGLSGRAAGEGPRRPPSILLVHTDDHASWAVGAYGNPDVRTPAIDRLAREGLRFSRAFVTTPVCSPARASLMTGLHSIQHGIADWIRDEESIGLEPRFRTFPELLKEAGYATGYFGKWHLGKEERFHPRRRGFDRFTGFLGGGNQPKDPTLEVDGTTAKRPGWLVDMVTDAALAFLEANRAGPSFCMVSYREPHAPWQPVQEQDEAPYRGKKLRLFKGSEVDPVRVEEMLRRYYACVTAVDRNLGRLLAKLAELGRAEDTLVIFTGDNGYMIGQHGLHAKGNAHRLAPPGGCRPNMFDPAIMVPLIARLPGTIAPGSACDALVAQTDVCPTLCEIAGIPAERAGRTEGKSLVPLMRASAASAPFREAIFGDYDQYQYKPRASLRMIRTGRWKLVIDGADGGARELYDLAADPDELTNLHDDPSARAAREDLAARLGAWRARLGDAAR